PNQIEPVNTYMLVPITPVKAATDPEDRSIIPEIITIVVPKAMIVIIDICLNMGTSHDKTKRNCELL
ncbi:MAG: hypothetical protein PF495_18755, partial [Spirochaetales bacterium]|nr:hypothetical protein [Spirochaetales bacterium]